MKMLGLSMTRRTWKSGSDHVCCNRHSNGGDGKRRARHRLRQIGKRELRSSIRKDILDRDYPLKWDPSGG